MKIPHPSDTVRCTDLPCLAWGTKALVQQLWGSRGQPRPQPAVCQEGGLQLPPAKAALPPPSRASSFTHLALPGSFAQALAQGHGPLAWLLCQGLLGSAREGQHSLPTASWAGRHSFSRLGHASHQELQPHGQVVRQGGQLGDEGHFLHGLEMQRGAATSAQAAGACESGHRSCSSPSSPVPERSHGERAPAWPNAPLAAAPSPSRGFCSGPAERHLLLLLLQPLLSHRPGGSAVGEGPTTPRGPHSSAGPCLLPPKPA